MSEQLRLFTALLPTRQEQQAVAALRRAWILPDARPRPSAERLHMTLQFVARWPAARLPEWQRALSSLSFQPFDLVLDRCERWSAGRGGLMVLRPRVSTALTALHAATEALSREVGVPAEAREWRPHVTVLRGMPGVELGPFRPLRWRVAAVSLVCSDLVARPPRYRLLGRYPADAVGTGQDKTPGPPR